MLSSASGETGRWLLNIHWQCGSITLKLSLSLLALLPLGSRRDKVDLVVWSTSFPRAAALMPCCMLLLRSMMIQVMSNNDDVLQLGIGLYY